MNGVLLAPFALRAYLASAAVGLTAPLIGTFLVQRRLSLVGDGIGHLAFAGVALGVLSGIAPIWGALILAVAGALFLEWLRSRGRLASDLSLALVFYLGVSLAAVLLSFAHRFDASAIGVLFGSILTASWPEVWLIAGLCLVVAGVTLALYRSLLAVALDEETASARGLPVPALNVTLVVLTALLVSAGMRTVGLLLISALLVVPVAAGSKLAHSLRATAVWAVALGFVAALGGVVASLAQGRIAPGGTIVLAAMALFALASVAGRRAARAHPRRGG